jgi:protein-S-isoprenylcysteine O-methyltransferase Ste14
MISIIIICWIVFILYWLISSFFVKKSETKRNWKQLIVPRIIVVGLVIIFITVSKSQDNLIEIFQPFFSSSLVLQIIWTVITVLGLAVAIWARIYLGRNWSGYVTYKKQHELVTNGPYKFVRHPIYSGAILMVIGTFLYYPNILVLSFLISWVTMFIIRIKKEEEIMIKLFGKKYVDYMKRTKALIPSVY